MSTTNPTTIDPDAVPILRHFAQVDGAYRDLAVAFRPAQAGTDAPGIIWLNGFLSDLGGTKAVALDGFAAEQGRTMLRFDYSAHGASGGALEDSTIGGWRSECRSVFNAWCGGRTIIVGSSMGGYLATLLAQDLIAAGRQDHIAGLVLIAPAIDMTERLLWNQFPAEIKAEIMEKGAWSRPSEYDDSVHTYTRLLIEEGRDHLMFDGPPLRFPFPTAILQGQLDDAVPPDVAIDLAALIEGDISLAMVPDGDHRLSRPEDIDLLIRTVSAIS